MISYLNNAFDITKIENEIMKPLLCQGKLDKELSLLDLETDKFINHKRYTIDEDTMVLFEGVLLYREPLNQYFDLRIFIDISFDEVLKRAAKRDLGIFGEAVIQKYKNKYIPIQKLYMEKLHIIGFKELGKEHLHEICKMLEDDDAREMLGVTGLPALDDYKGKNNISYAIINQSNQFIGIVELFNISWKNRRGELSIVIKAEMRNKGFGYDAINKMLETAFLEYGMNRIWLRVLETNTNAINLYKKVGFFQEGICRGESLRKGQFIDQIQMSILAKDWISNYMK